MPFWKPRKFRGPKHVKSKTKPKEGQWLSIGNPDKKGRRLWKRVG